MSEASERLVVRAGRSRYGYVMPAGIGELSAVRAMARRGEARPVPGMPWVWQVPGKLHDAGSRG